MSYSFSIKANSKELAKQAVKDKFDSDVVTHQPVHEKDRPAVLANANAAIDLLADDIEKDISVSVNGYVTWPGADNSEFSTVSISACASHATRAAV